MCVYHKAVGTKFNYTSALFAGRGGVLYTIGAVIYAKGKKLAYMHTIFHVFVVAASVMQFFVVFTVAV